MKKINKNLAQNIYAAKKIYKHISSLHEKDISKCIEPFL